MRSFSTNLLVFGSVTFLNGLAAEQTIDFQREISPLLSDNCYSCHGPDSEKREAELRLDIQSAAHESVIVPGDPEKSELIARITHTDPEEQMPPPDSEKTLRPSEIELLQRWISGGANYEKHWSFESPQRHEPPSSSNSNWGNNPIDAFVLATLEKSELQPSEQADKSTLIRRITLDLTGVPPTRQEVAAFLTDKFPNAFERVVDRLLESERYGERMAILWLDAARYADTMGYQADWERTQWPWRTWVIDAYNQNLPFDEFTIEQLAADLLPNPSTEQLIATGFNRNHRINDEGGIIPEEYLVEYLVDRVETTSGTWLGMTFGCARCHDHKYDPLSQKSFYEFLSFFNAVPENGKDGRKGYATPFLRVAVRGKQDQYEALQNKVEILSKQFADTIPKLAIESKEWIQQTKPELANGSIQWSIEKPSKILGGDAIEFKVLQDHSVLSILRGFGVEKPTYRVNISPSPGVIKAFRLEALLHETLPGGLTLGDGGFVLTDFTVNLKRKGKKKPTKLKLALAKAGYEQTDFPVSHAIDADAQSGWAVDEDAKKANHVAVFSLEEAIEIKAGDTLQINLVHKSPEPNQAIGRFRLSTSDSDQTVLSIGDGLPSNVASAIRKELSERSRKELDLINKYHASIAPETASLRKDLERAQYTLDEFETEFTTNVMVMQEMDEPRPTHVLERGLYNKPGELVSSNVPAEMLGPLPTDAPANRLGLAQWLVSGEHPLTARVVMNRYWAMLFGSGLVNTIEDFGLQGAYPSHPELLDWLATEFPLSGWNTKAMLKLIATSATYQQSSYASPSIVERDPNNRLLSRMTRFRLPAETIRDQALFVSDLLVEKIGGPSVKPYQPEGLWSELSFASKSRTTDFYIQDTGDSLYRRSLYTFWKRTVPPPTMATFDAPSREMCVLSRPKTNTPLQALALMNDPTFVEAARVLAENMMAESSDSETQLRNAFQAILARAPSAFELQTLHQGFQKRLAYFKDEQHNAQSLISVGSTAAQTTLNPSYLAALSTSMMNLFNLDETIHHE
jgi:hypothetical protein